MERITEWLIVAGFVVRLVQVLIVAALAALGVATVDGVQDVVRQVEELREEVKPSGSSSSTPGFLRSHDLAPLWE